MVVPYGIKQKAFGMYVIGIPGGKIARLLSLKDATVYKWIQKEEWEKIRQELENARKDNSVLSSNEQDLKLLDSVLGLWVEAVKDKRDHLKEHIRPRDLAETIKMRRLIKGESTENVVINNEVTNFKEEIDKIRAKRKEEENV